MSMTKAEVEQAASEYLDDLGDAVWDRRGAPRSVASGQFAGHARR